MKKPDPVSLLCCVSLLLLVFLAHAGSLRAPFVFDDHSYVLGAMKSPDGSMPWQALRGTTRPLVYLSFLADYAVAGHSALFYHVMNLVYHGVLACLLFSLLCRLLPDSKRYLAWAGTSLWLVHPVLSNVLGQVWQRGEMLAAIWYVACLYYFVRAMQTDRRKWFLFSVLSGFAGALTKETTVTLPAAVLLLHWCCFRGSEFRTVRRCAGYYGALCSLWGLLYLMQCLAPDYHSNPMVGLNSVVMTPFEHALTVPGVQRHYLTVLCVPGRMIFDPAWPISRTLGDVDPVGLALLAVLSLAALYGVARRLPWAVLPALYIIYLSPTTSIVPTGSPVQEYRMYLPAFFLICAAAIGWDSLQRLVGSRHGRWLSLAFLLALGAFFTAKSWTRYESYGSEADLWWDTVIKSPNNRRAVLNLAGAMRRNYCRETTISRLESLRGHSSFGPGANLVLGRFLMNSGRLADAAAALEQAQQDASLSAVQVDLGRLSLRQGRPEQGAEHFRAFLKERRRDPMAEIGLVACHLAGQDSVGAEKQLRSMRRAYPSWRLVPGLQALLASRDGRTEEAEAFAREMLSMADYEGNRYTFGYSEIWYYTNADPGLHPFRVAGSVPDLPERERGLYNAAVLLLGAGYPTLARLALEQIQLSGIESADVYVKRSYAEFLLGRYAEAGPLLDKAIRLAPQALTLHWNRAVLAMATGQLGEARIILLELHRQQRPAVPFAAMALARLIEMSGDATGAAMIYEEVLRVWPEHMDARLGLHRARSGSSAQVR